MSRPTGSLTADPAPGPGGPGRHRRLADAIEDRHRTAAEAHIRRHGRARVAHDLARGGGGVAAGSRAFRDALRVAISRPRRTGRPWRLALAAAAGVGGVVALLLAAASVPGGG